MIVRSWSAVSRKLQGIRGVPPRQLHHYAADKPSCNRLTHLEFIALLAGLQAQESGEELKSQQHDNDLPARTT